MRRYALLLMLATLWPLSAGAQNAPAPSPQIIICRGGQDITIDAQTAACSAVIAAGSGTDLAEAYSERCALEYSESLRNELNNKPGEALQDAALADCNKSIALKPDYAPPYRTRGEIYNIKKQFNAALADFSRVIALRPDSPNGYYLRGNANNDKGDYDAAIADFEKAIAMAGTDANKADYINGAIANFAQHELDKAKAARAALSAGQKLGDPRAWCDGKSLPQEGFKEEMVIKGCTLLIESGKETGDVLTQDYFNRAEANFFTDEVDRAIADYSAYLERKNGNSKAYWSRAALYMRKDRDALAVADLTKAIKLEPKDALNYSYRGQAYIKLGKYDAAIADFNRVLALSPGDPEALYQRGMAYIGRKDYGHALVDCRMAIQLSHTSEATVGNNVCGNAHLLSGDIKAALADYEHALELWPEYPAAIYGRGVAKLHSGDVAGGRADIAAAEKFQADIAAVEARAGIKP